MLKPVGRKGKTGNAGGGGGARQTRALTISKEVLQSQFDQTPLHNRVCFLCKHQDPPFLQSKILQLHHSCCAY